MTDDSALDTLSNLIDDAFDKVFGRQPADNTLSAPDKEHFPNLYESIEDYTAQTGKRFRMTKSQKSRDLTREQAFNEMYLGDN